MPPRRPQLVPSQPARNAADAFPSPPSPVHPFDARHNTDTGGLIPADDLRTGAPADRFVTAYYAVAPSILRSLLEIWQGRTRPPFALDHYTFLDIGCGKGRALLLAAENPFREVVGIELNPALTAIATANLAAARHRFDPLAPVRIIAGDALATPLPDPPLLVFLFHPFEAPAVRRLLRTLEAHTASHPRGVVDILYVNAEHAAILDRSPALTCLWSGRVPMSTEDHIADLQEIATQTDYGSTGDELCGIYRLTGRPRSPANGR